MFRQAFEKLSLILKTLLLTICLFIIAMAHFSLWLSKSIVVTPGILCENYGISIPFYVWPDSLYPLQAWNNDNTTVVGEYLLLGAFALFIVF